MPPRKPTDRANEKVDEAVEEAREATIPLYIRRTCTPHQERVWSTIALLLKTHPRAEFGLREIAQEAGLTSIPKVKGWIEDLVEMGVLARETPAERGAGSRDNFPLIRSTYAIPYVWILEESLKLARTYVERHVRGGNALLPKTAPGSGNTQLALELHVSEGIHDHVANGIHEGVSEGIHDHVANGIHEEPSHVANGIHGHVSEGIHMDGWMDGLFGMDGSSGRSAKKKRDGPGRPPAIPPPPAAETYATHPGWIVSGPLSSHPRDLWRSACVEPRAIDDEQLAALAAEHDPPTGGHGWYWVGRAILAVSIDTTPRSVAIVRNTLLRWRAEDSYGSDRRRRGEVPTYDHRGADRGTHGRQRPEPGGGARAGAPGGGGAGLGDEPGAGTATDPRGGREPAQADDGVLSPERAEEIKRAARERFKRQQAQRR